MGFSKPTYYSWIKEKDSKRLVMGLLEKYFTAEELEEFINTKKIEKFEKHHTLLRIEDEVVMPMINKILNSVKPEIATYALTIIKGMEEKYYERVQALKKAQEVEKKRTHSRKASKGLGGLYDRGESSKRV